MDHQKKMQASLKRGLATNEDKMRTALDKLEKQLEKVRGCSPLTHGWQTQKLAKASRTWDVLAQRKMELLQELQYCESKETMCSNCNCWKHSRAMCS